LRPTFSARQPRVGGSDWETLQSANCNVWGGHSVRIFTQLLRRQAK